MRAFIQGGHTLASAVMITKTSLYLIRRPGRRKGDLVFFSTERERLMLFPERGICYFPTVDDILAEDWEIHTR